MEEWRISWRLASREMKRNWIGWLVSIVFFLYVALMLVILTHQLLQEVKAAGSIKVTVFAFNVFVLAVLPNCGFLLGRRYFSYLRKDTFTLHLRVMKSLPISDRILIVSRYMQLVASAIIISSVIFIPLYISEWLDPQPIQLGGVHYIQLAISWCSYSIAAGSCYVYFEMGHTGKRYLVYSLWFGIAYLAAAIASALLIPQPFWLLMIDGVKLYGWLLPLALAALALVSIALCSRALERRLAARDLH